MSVFSTYQYSLPGHASDLILTLPAVLTTEEVDEVEAFLALVITSQRRAAQAHTGAPGNSRAIRDDDDHSSR